MSDKIVQKCSFPGCDNNPRSKKQRLCCAHYQQQRKGQPLRPLYLFFRKRGSPPRIEYDEVPCPNPELFGPCHVFRGGKTKRGYAQVSLAGKPMYVHRYVWEQTRGPIPDGLEIDHRCRVRACCNVDHLRMVDSLTNTLENSIGPCARNAAKTHCVRAHPLSGENIYLNKKGSRVCKTCEREQARKNYKKRKLRSLTV